MGKTHFEIRQPQVFLARPTAQAHTDPLIPEVWELVEHELRGAMGAIAAAMLLTATPFADGADALLKGDWQEAVDAFTESIEAMPTAKAFVNRGIAHGRLGKFQEALDDYNAAIRIDPREPVAYVNRSRLYDAANQPNRETADLPIETRR